MKKRICEECGEEYEDVRKRRRKNTQDWNLCPSCYGRWIYQKEYAVDPPHVMTFTEIAAELGISRQAAQAAYYRGVKRFKENWLKMVGDPPDFDEEGCEREMWFEKLLKGLGYGGGSEFEV